MGKKPSPNEIVDSKNTALSLLKLFLPYITDFLFAALTFIVVLLATWGLHYLGNTLGLVNSLFFWRLFELFVISFGTLWCTVFFLKVIVEFFKKLKRTLGKPTKEVGVELSYLYLRDIVRRFGEPCIKHPVSLVVCSLIVFTVLYIGISFADLIRDDCDDASILACEMICETGPDFMEPIDKHLIMLKDYAKYTEKKHFSVLLKVFPKYSTNEIFADANEILVSAKGGQDKFANEIWRAGEEIMLFRLKAPKLLPRVIALHEYRKAPEWLLNDIKNALEKSREAARLFDEKPSVENAVNLCMANKKTMLLMFLIRNSRQNQLFEDFQEIVKATKESQDNVARRLPDYDSRKEFLSIISDSEQRRFDILDEIKKRNMQAAIERMWDAIELAYSRRDKLLGLCAKIRRADNYSEVIGS